MVETVLQGFRCQKDNLFSNQAFLPIHPRTLKVHEAQNDRQTESTPPWSYW